jgi:hypothetical protein
MVTASLELVLTDLDFDVNPPTRRILTNNNKEKHNKMKYKNDNSTDDVVFVTVSMYTSPQTILPLISLVFMNPSDPWGYVVLSSFLSLDNFSLSCFYTPSSLAPGVLHEQLRRDTRIPACFEQER